MTWSRMAGLRIPSRSRTTGAAGPRRPLLLAGALLLAGFGGLLWIGISAANPHAYVRAASGWLFFP